MFVTAFNSLAFELDHLSVCVYNTAGTACYGVASIFFLKLRTANAVSQEVKGIVDSQLNSSMLF